MGWLASINCTGVEDGSLWKEEAIRLSFVNDSRIPIDALPALITIITWSASSTPVSRKQTSEDIA